MPAHTAVPPAPAASAATPAAPVAVPPVAVPKTVDTPKADEKSEEFKWDKETLGGCVALAIACLLVIGGIAKFFGGTDGDKQTPDKPAAAQQQAADPKKVKRHTDEELKNAFYSLRTTDVVSSNGLLDQLRSGIQTDTAESVKKLLGKPNQVSVSSGDATKFSESWTYKGPEMWLSLQFRSWDAGKTFYLTHKHYH